MSSPLAYTRALLALWARWARLTDLGYPSSAPFVIKVRGSNGAMPAEAAVIDAIITQIQRTQDEQRHAAKIREHYLRDGSIAAKIAERHISAGHYYRELDEAQWAVHVRLIR